jgi:hypothetical protein
MEDLMDKKLFALLLAGTLMIPHIPPALGNHGTVALSLARGSAWSAQPWNDLQLPAVPYLETMPWLTYGSAIKGPKIDMLWRPKMDTLGPLLAEPARPRVSCP